MGRFYNQQRRWCKSVSLHPLLLFCFFVSVLSACSSDGNKFKLEGTFKNLNQGEFYIYNFDEGQKDTIAVNDGRFVYERVMEDTVVLTLLFPNYSEVPIFAAPGATVTMEGDASHLREVEVKGTPDNEEMTAFRLKIADELPQTAEKMAVAFIKNHPKSLVSYYLLRRFVLLSFKPDYVLADSLCSQLRASQPQNLNLIKLSTMLSATKNTPMTGDSVPQFCVVDTKGDTVKNSDLRSDVNALAVWASWNSESHTLLSRLRSMEKIYGRRLHIVSVQLDSSVAEGKNILDRDSIGWSNVCDSLMWQSPILQAFGVKNVPAVFLMNKNGIIDTTEVYGMELERKIKSLMGDSE